MITGASRGIGRALALGFADQGARLALVARSSPELSAVEEEVRRAGTVAASIPADLSDPAMQDYVIEQALAEFSTIDILINNAAVGSSANPKTVAQFDDEFWNYTLALNLTAAYRLAKSVLPLMITKKEGRIINIASLAGKTGLPFGAAYSASKHGLIGLTRSLAMEVIRDGITVNAICPGPVRSDASDKRLEFEANRTGQPFEELEQRSTPIGRRLYAYEIVPLALLLAQESASVITGQAFNVDGGLAMF